MHRMWSRFLPFQQQANALPCLRHKKKEPEKKFRTDQTPEEIAALEATLREIKERENSYKFSNQ